MFIINVLVSMVFAIISCATGYIVPLCLRDGGVCDEEQVFSLPELPFYNKFCRPAGFLEKEDRSLLTQIFCATCDLIGNFSNLLSAGVKCILAGRKKDKKSENYFEALIDFFNLEHLYEKQEKETTCMDIFIRDHYVAIICILLFVTSVGMFWRCFCRRAKVEPEESLTFINKFVRGNDGDKSLEDDKLSVSESGDDI